MFIFITIFLFSLKPMETHFFLSLLCFPSNLYEIGRDYTLYPSFVPAKFQTDRRKDPSFKGIWQNT